MKTSVAILLAIVLSECSDPLSPTEQPPVSLTFIDAAEFNAKLLLANNSMESIWYGGYSKSSPIVSVEIFSDSGWTALHWGWCGTGVERQEVKPKKSVEIFAPFVNKNVRTRIALRYQSGRSDEFAILTSSEYFVN